MVKSIIPVTYVLFVLLLPSILLVGSDIQSLNFSTREKILAHYQAQGVKMFFKAYHFLYSKTYNFNTEEGIRRYKIFRENVKSIEEHNSKNLSYKQGVNHLTDMTEEEVKKFYNIRPMNVKEVFSKLNSSLRGVTLDNFFDDEEIKTLQVNSVKAERKDINYTSCLPEIKNQGNCGSCWAFATIAAIEGNYCLSNGKTVVDLSEQQLVDCDSADKGCDGGWFTEAIEYTFNNSLIEQKDYPYKGEKQSCQANGKTASPVKVKSFKSKTNANDIFNLLAKGPVWVAIDASKGFFSYKSGVWDELCSDSPNHAVLLMGYDNKTTSWIIRNSMGADWGDKGYMSIKENTANNQSCNLEKNGYQPIV